MRACVRARKSLKTFITQGELFWLTFDPRSTNTDNLLPGRTGASVERSDEDDGRAAQAHPYEPESHPRRGDVRGDQQGLRGMG